MTFHLGGKVVTGNLEDVLVVPGYSFDCFSLKAWDRLGKQSVGKDGIASLLDGDVKAPITGGFYRQVRCRNCVKSSQAENPSPANNSNGAQRAGISPARKEKPSDIYIDLFQASFGYLNPSLLYNTAKKSGLELSGTMHFSDGCTVSKILRYTACSFSTHEWG